MPEIISAFHFPKDKLLSISQIRSITLQNVTDLSMRLNDYIPPIINMAPINELQPYIEIVKADPLYGGILGSSIFFLIEEGIRKYKNEVSYRQGEKEKNWPRFLKDITLEDMATLLRYKNRIYGNDALDGTVDAVRKAIWSREERIDHISAIFRTRKIWNVLIEELPKSSKRVDNYFYIQIHPSQLEQICKTEIGNFPDFRKMPNYLKNRDNDEYINNPNLDLLRRYCNLILSLKKFSNLKGRSDIGQWIHVIPYSSEIPSLRATLFERSVCFAVFDKGCPGTVGGTALNMSDKYVDLACKELKKCLKPEAEIEDFGKKIKELSESAIEKLTFIETGKNWGVGRLKNTRSFLENCVNLKLEDLDTRLKNVNLELKAHEYL